MTSTPPDRYLNGAFAAALVTRCPPMPALGLAEWNEHVHPRTRYGGQVPVRDSDTEPRRFRLPRVRRTARGSPWTSP